MITEQATLAAPWLLAVRVIDDAGEYTWWHVYLAWDMRSVERILKGVRENPPGKLQEVLLCPGAVRIPIPLP